MYIANSTYIYISLYQNIQPEIYTPINVNIWSNKSMFCVINFDMYIANNTCTSYCIDTFENPRECAPKNIDNK